MDTEVIKMGFLNLLLDSVMVIVGGVSLLVLIGGLFEMDYYVTHTAESRAEYLDKIFGGAFTLIIVIAYFCVSGAA
jgi:hypothetical protein